MAITNILIVDDEARFLKTTQALLEKGILRGQQSGEAHGQHRAREQEHDDDGHDPQPPVAPFVLLQFGAQQLQTGVRGDFRQ